MLRNRQGLTGILLVHKNSPYTEASQLKNQTLGFLAPNAFGASLYMRALLSETVKIPFETTYLGTHPNVFRHVLRGDLAAGGSIDSVFKGVLVHDGWMPYKALECQHALCNQHHLRELTYLLEELDQAWAGDMIELLQHANHFDNLNCADGKSPRYDSQKYQGEVRDLRYLYDAILAQARAANPIAPATGKRGRPKQSKATNLIGRLCDYSDDVWRFMTQPDVPFTKNVAEQTVRMPKVKQKVSGCFRTLPGAQNYCVIRSYCATMHKQGANIFESLVAAFKGAPPQPSFGWIKQHLFCKFRFWFWGCCAIASVRASCSGRFLRSSTPRLVRPARH